MSGKSPEGYMIVKDREFTGETVRLDNIQFESCKFTGCEIIYAATGGFQLINNDFLRCHFVLEGAATRTMIYLAALNKLAPDIVDKYFEHVKTGKIFELAGVKFNDE